MKTYYAIGVARNREYNTLSDILVNIEALDRTEAFDKMYHFLALNCPGRLYYYEIVSVYTDEEIDLI